MWSIKQLLVIALCALLCVPSVLAQDQQPVAKGGTGAAQDVTIIIQQQQVRFVAQKAGEEMRLQVFDQSGELVFDSGAVEATEVNWPLQAANGEMLKSGLYAYTLSIKEVGKEAGTAEARLRRGHFIVDRANDRDGADKLWVTSQNESGVGTELTVAKDEVATVAGAAISERRPVGQRAEIAGRDAAGRTIEAETQSQTKAEKLAAAPAATVGRIAKFTTANDLGDSVITEQNGNVGLGTTAPLSKFHVLSDANNLLPPRLESSGTTSFAAGWDFYHGVTGKGYVGVPNSAAEIAPGEMIVFGGAGTKTSLWAGIKRGLTVDTSGAVGIGTTTPFGNLEIAGFSPFVTLRETQQGRNEPAYIQNAGGSLVFKPTGSGNNTAAMVMQANTLNVGIGTTTPESPLHVHGTSGVISSGSGAALFFRNRETTTSTNYWGWYSSNNIARLWQSEVGDLISITPNGNVGIGAATPAAKLHVAGEYLRVDGRSNEQVYIGGDGLGNDAQLGSSNPTVTDVALWNRATNRHMKLVTSSVIITGGADFAENFEVNAAPETSQAIMPKIAAGMVVSIDPARPGKLKLSAQAYDRRVAGIISGAGGVQPGMTMGQEKTLADGNHPVALSGRVYVWADARRGAIRSGDLLTTARTPGHAMKVADSAKAQGAIIGKAMTGLKSGKGLILVLVTLQ